jgi:RecB family exonuclease
MNDEEEVKPLRLSVSKTKCFAQCRKQFEFSYIKKLPKKDHDYHVFGKFCHKVLEDFHLFYINGSQDPYNISMNKAFKTALEEYKDQMTKDMKKDCFTIINNYLKLVSDEKRDDVSANVLACEKTFELPIERDDGKIVVLNGMIDRIQLDKDNIIHVADYKTTKNKKYLKDDFFQLLTYAYVLVSEDPSITTVRGSYVLLRHNFEYITKDFHIDEILKVKNKYLEYANDIMEEKEYPATPQILCRWCDFIDICPEGKKMQEPSKIFGEVGW